MIIKKGKLKMNLETIKDLEILIKSNIEESNSLEYKSAESLKPNMNDNQKKEIAKDVSGMANSNGGIIIYGIREFDIKEKRHLPERIEPIPYSFSKEDLEHIISSNVSPRIDEIIIKSIPFDKEHHVLIVNVPQSKTAIQNTKDFRYYKRLNFEVKPMLDFEIRNIMNRNIHPDIDLKIIIIKEIDKVKNKKSPFNIDTTPLIADFNQRRIWLKNKKIEDEKIEIEYYLEIFIVNIGNILVNHVNYELEILGDIFYKYKYENHFNSKSTIIKGKNEIRDVLKNTVAGPYTIPEFGPYRYEPILPKTEFFSKNIRLIDDLNNQDEILFKYKISADNAIPKNKSIKLSEIEIIEIDKTKNI